MALSTECGSGCERIDHPSNPLATRWELKIGTGESIELIQYISLVPERLHPEPHWQALRLVRAARWRGFGALRAANREAWDEIWKGRIVLKGAGERWQDAADSAFYYLMSSAHPATPCSVPPFGLSDSGYSGHLFWDTETFMFPVYLLTAPETAKALLRYRVECLPAARTNAALNGYGGAMFPWESGATGAEVTPVFASTSEEHHVTLDIAFACLQYIHAVDDPSFVQNELWTLLEDVCTWIASRVVHTDRGYEIRNVVGVDEGIENIDNNSYTNIAAKIVLEQVCAFARANALPADCRLWEKIATGMYIPVDEDARIILKHDAYRYEGGPCVAETLGVFFPLTYEHPDSEIQDNTFDYHLALAETVLHFPMLSSLFGVWASRRGDRELALRCFTKGILEFVCEPYLSFSEWRGHSRPNFLTNPAGFLTACLYGLTGIQLNPEDPGGWPSFPVVLPEGWESIEIERIWIRNRRARLTARQGDSQARIEWLDG
jgi:protein-glucosylgalactosylhydroxylysine glucosidase